MTNAKIDNNGEGSLLSVTDDVATTIKYLKVDPSTDRLLIDVAITTVTPTLNRTKIDNNREAASQAVDSNEVIRPFLIDATSGFLSIDLLSE